jgi:hypothetical protein
MTDATAQASPEIPPLAAIEAAESEIERIVADWVNTHINNSPISRNVEAINHFNQKLPLLIAALEKKG